MENYYRVQANINLDAIYDNLVNLKKLTKADTRLMAIVKADGYGHGAVAIVKTVDGIVDAYGVAIIEEAIELRRANATKKPILILGYTPSPLYPQLLQYDITQTVYDYEMAEALSKVAVSQNTKAKVHIKLDTGMSRIGFKDTQASIETIKKINELPGIEITGMFTHFACADMTNKESSRKQLSRYLDFADKLQNEGITLETKHVSNSAGIMDLPEANLDMVRSGITTYGLYPSDEVLKERVALKPAMEIKSCISFVKELDAGVGIGYGSSYITEHPMRVATIPVGYADGYPRALSNKGRVLINGQSVPIVGRICMDQFMVDVTKIEDVKAGDVVTIIGTDGDETITVEELSAMAYSFNYEFVCDISKRVPRVFYRHGKQVGSMDFYNCQDKSLHFEAGNW
ncbi:alanine racemase [Lachnospiraceae bacterium KM106-2]|nr:alanine racemase [Lachnospiraceae bacterium KM106-2]